ncbi:MAG: T9SS type A sorting domain-containing protein, partial [Ferruginibacter sp.]
FFEVEKSVDGITWKKIAAIKGKINSTTINAYSYTDNEKYNEQVFYRLKQVDINGKFEYSNIILVDNCVSKMNAFSIYPNPSNGNLAIKLNGFTGVQLIQIYNAVGQFVKEEEVLQNKKINISDLQNGLYIVKLKNNSYSIKLIKQ